MCVCTQDALSLHTPCFEWVCYMKFKIYLDSVPFNITRPPSLSLSLFPSLSSNLEVENMSSSPSPLPEQSMEVMANKTATVPNDSDTAACASEAGGTFILILSILRTGAPPSIAAALFVSIVTFGPVSGGHFNPVVTMVKCADRSISKSRAGKYIIAQCIGAFAALAFHYYLSKKVKVTSTDLEEE